MKTRPLWLSGPNSQKQVYGADIETFQVYSYNFGSKEKAVLYYRPFAKDKKNVYHKYELINGADPTTFSVLGADDYDYAYSKDSNSVYFCGKRIIEADTETFVFLGYSEKLFGLGCGNFDCVATAVSWAKDKKFIYRNGEIHQKIHSQTSFFNPISIFLLSFLLAVLLIVTFSSIMRKR